MLSLAVFCVGCLVGGYAVDFSELILARAIQGAAAGVIQPLSMVIIFEVFPPDRRGSAMEIYGLGADPRASPGPTLGCGLSIDNYSWRYTFLACLPLCLLGHAARPDLPADRKTVLSASVRLARFRPGGGRDRLVLAGLVQRPAARLGS